jgi:hypothetical protein
VPRSLGLVCTVVVVVGEPFPLAARRLQFNWMLDAGLSGTRHQTRLSCEDCLVDCCFSAVRELSPRGGGGRQIQSKLGADYLGCHPVYWRSTEVL